MSIPIINISTLFLCFVFFCIVVFNIYVHFLLFHGSCFLYWSEILQYRRPLNTIPISCLKIIIVIAHSRPDFRAKLVANKPLLRLIVRQFIPPLRKKGKWQHRDILSVMILLIYQFQINFDFVFGNISWCNVIDLWVRCIEDTYGYPQYLALKIFRVLLSTEQHAFLEDFMEYNVFDRIIEYLNVTTQLNVSYGHFFSYIIILFITSIPYTNILIQNNYALLPWIQ